jgi:hypothetical protein
MSSDPVLEALNRTSEEGWSPGDIDNIIAFLRKSRANFEAGVKPKKEGAAPIGELLAALKIEPPKPSAGFKRRV